MGIADLIMDVKDDFDCMTFSMNVYNVICRQMDFYASDTDEIVINTKFFVGSFLNIRCYVDLKMFGEEIVLHYSDELARDIKIDSIISSVKKETIKKIYLK